MVKHSVRFVKLSRKDPFILTLYDHYSHLRNIEVIKCERENGMHIVYLPPHSIHKLQPLDIPLLQPLITLRTEDRNWL
jgi:hypothetical protein